MALIALKQNFIPYIRQYTSPNENFAYNYPLILSRYEIIWYAREREGRRENFCLNKTIK